MAIGDLDWLVRLQAFAHLDELTARWGDVLPWEALRDGFEFNDQRVTLIGARGIWKPSVLDLPISLTTSHRDPYGDEAGADGLLHYRYFGQDPTHRDNEGLRLCLTEGRPLVYFRGVERGWYSAIWPLVLVHDDPGSLTVVGACEDVEALRPGVAPSAADDARRRYVTRLAVVRLHQAAFRQRVLTAYKRTCTVCRLRHPELLDAAHILADTHENGEPIVPNGLAMCKIHHAAFDRDILGIRPDHIVEIREDVLAEVDGPMLRYGLQAAHGTSIVLPRKPTDRPARGRLEERYEAFRQAS